jgi:hypothetical protein
MQATAKVVEGAQHPDRNGQFEYINRLAGERIAAGEPVISVDCKKKELVNGRKANGGKEYQPKGQPERVDVHDFPDPEVPKAIPYGVYDVGGNEGWMSVDDDHDTAAFAVNAIARRWNTMGRVRYPQATTLMITADAGGSNGYPNRLWKVELAKLAAETGLRITACHYRRAPGSGTRSSTGCSASSPRTGEAGPSPPTRSSSSWSPPPPPRRACGSLAEWDQGYYPTGTAVSDEELARLPMTRHEWHPKAAMW